MDRSSQADMIMGNMLAALETLYGCPDFAALVPEVRVNLAYALPGAGTPREVAAIDGRITVVRGLPHAAGLPRWGASDHLARRLIEARKYDAAINAAINFRYDKVIDAVVQRYCAERGILYGHLDRTGEPDEVTAEDGASMPWKVKQLVAACGGMPRLFYEGEGWGKEPLFLAMGGSATEVAGIAVDIARRCRKK